MTAEQVRTAISVRKNQTMMLLIIGWDDSYSKDNFSVDLEGTEHLSVRTAGEANSVMAGFFIFLTMIRILVPTMVVYTGIEDSDNYDHIYQSDLCGWVGQLGYNKESIYGANVYTAESNQNLTAASFYATGKDSEYQLYVVKNFEDESSLSNMTPVASGKLSNAGYYTIPFDKQIALDAGERYAVVLFTVHRMQYIRLPLSMRRMMPRPMSS